MAINQTKYVLITSGVGGAPQVTNRELIGRVMTDNILVPMGGILEFTSDAEVADYFKAENGLAEYEFAKKYFGYISKDIRKPKKLSFARYSTSATKAGLMSGMKLDTLDKIQKVSAGNLKLVIGSDEKILSNLNFSSANTYGGVAAIIQSAIIADPEGRTDEDGPLDDEREVFSGASVSFFKGRFILTSGLDGEGKIEPLTSETVIEEETTLADILGLSESSGVISSEGTSETTLSAEMDRVSNISNNFGSFCFAERLTEEQIIEVAQWNHNQNAMYVYSVPMASYLGTKTFTDKLVGFDGTCLTYDPYSAYAEYMPMAVGACIDYTSNNASTNFMYQSFPSDKPSITTNAGSKSCDAQRINYLGATQQAGKIMAFYQMGFLQGGIEDIGVYYNEMWLKDALITDFLNMFLSLKQVPASRGGISTAMGIMQGIIEQAKLNGTVLAGKILTNVQKAYITQISNDVEAWRAVEIDGYWRDVTIKQQDTNGVIEYVLDYTLIYGKGDSIRKVEGRNILI